MGMAFQTFLREKILTGDLLPFKFLQTFCAHIPQWALGTRVALQLYQLVLGTKGLLALSLPLL